MKNIKSGIIFCLILALGCVSCTNVTRPLTNADKEKIVGEAKVLISMIVQTCETADAAKLKATYVEGPDFVSLVGGVYADYEQSLKNVDNFFANVASQKSTIRSEKYVVLDASTVLYTATSRWETKMKNNSTVVMDPLGMQFILKRVDQRWKIISWTEETAFLPNPQ